MLADAIAYGAALLWIGVLDALWIGLIAKGLYQRALGQLIAERPVLPAAVLFYLIYPIGVVVFAVVPAMAMQSWHTALVMGLLFGFFNYATYDLTNWAVIRGWSAAPLAFDLPWGTVLTGTCALVAYLATTLV